MVWPVVVFWYVVVWCGHWHSGCSVLTNTNKVNKSVGQSLIVCVCVCVLAKLQNNIPLSERASERIDEEAI